MKKKIIFFHLKEKSESKMSFHISNTKLHLTYKTHLDAKKWLKWASKNTKLPKIDKYSIVNETSDKMNPYDHTHILVLFENKLISKKSDILDYDDIHPNIKKVTTIKHFKNCVIYHHKQNKPNTNINLEDKEFQEIDKIDFNKYTDYDFDEDVDFSIASDPKEFKVQEFIKQGGKTLNNEDKKESQLKMSKYWTNEDTWACNSEQDALKKNNNPKMTGGILVAFKYKPVSYGPEPKVIWRIFQKELLFEIKGYPSDRSLIWNLDLPGGSGKSSFAKHLMKWHGAFLATGADTKDLPMAMINHKNRGGKFNVILIDLSRTSKEDDDFYDILEQAKTGIIMCKKYNSLMLDLECDYSYPHIIIFANRMPRKYYKVKVIVEDINKETGKKRIVEKEEIRDIYTEDRWDIRTIGKIINPETKKPDWIVTHRDYNPIEKDELPEGYSRPGESIPVAEPDEILTDSEESNEEIEVEKEEPPIDVKENNEDWDVESTTGFSSVSRSKPITPVKAKTPPKKCFKSPPAPNRPTLKNMFGK
jgi:hypothetical protein